MTPTLRMQNNNVLIKLDPEVEKVAGGMLFKPETAHDHVLRTGEVVAVGPGRWNDKGERYEPMECKPGMRVLFVKFIATHTESAKQLKQYIGPDFAIIKDKDALLDVGELKLEDISQ